MDTSETLTLIDALSAAVSVTHKGFVFLNDDLRPSEWSFRALSLEAFRRGRALRALGLKKGDRLAMIVPDGEEFVLSFLGAITAGIVPVPMYPPLALGKLDGYIEVTERILRSAGARFLLTTKRVAPILWSLASRVSNLEDIVLTERLAEGRSTSEAAGNSNGDIEIRPTDICFLQFTSGSTSDPKGVIVTHAGLVANSRAIMFDGLKTDPEKDRGVTWLPLYHDMGLIGFVVAPLIAQVAVTFLPTMTFVKRPSVWMETISKYKGTITFAPNFAFGLAAKRVQRLSELDLSSLRVLGCGAEPIHAGTVSAFVETFKPAGLNPNALMPCYGMAEATLAMAFDSLVRPMETIRIDKEIYESANEARPVIDADPSGTTIDLVACGTTFPGHELRVMAADGRLLPDYKIGEIVFRGPSVTPGYFKNPDASRKLLRDGWLHTGDLGFIVDGKIFVSGREKDIIILNGRNHYPQTIEWVVEGVPGVRRGNVVAFSVDGAHTEELVVVAETKSRDVDALRLAVREHVQTALGLPLKEVALVPPGSLPKTSSGKLQRRKTRAQYEDGSLGTEGSRAIGSSAARVMLFRHYTSSVFARIRHQVRVTIPSALSAPFARWSAGRGLEQERGE